MSCPKVCHLRYVLALEYILFVKEFTYGGHNLIFHNFSTNNIL